MKSVYFNKEKKESVFYHLHPELVPINEGKEKCTYLCNECYRKIIENEEIPELSIAAGIDFGHYKRIGLTFPNTFERTILALVRLYHKIMKISQNDHQTSDYTHSRIRGHCISFGHDSPIIANDLLDKKQLSEFIKIHFVVQLKMNMIV